MKTPGYSIQTLADTPRVPFKFDGRVLFTSPGYELVHLTLQPGESMDLHAQPFPVVFFVVEGTGILSVADETLTIECGITVHVETDVMRAWANKGGGPLRFLVSKLLKVNE